MAASLLLGFVLALAAAASFGANRSFGSKALLHSPSAPEVATYVTLLTGVAVTVTILVISGQAAALWAASLPALVLFALVGVFHFRIGRVLSYTGVKNIGANQVSTLISTQALYSLFFAVLFLSETVTILLGVGAGLILAAIFLLEANKSATKRGGNTRTGYASGLLAGLIFGISPILIKIGLNIFPHFIAATFIAYISGLLFHSITMRPKKIKHEFGMLNRSVFLSFVIMGIFGVSSQLLRFASLSFATVVIVAPVLSTNPIFTILFTRIHAKGYEIFGPRTILSIAMVVLGAVLVSFATGF